MRIDLSWTDNAANETGFRIERCSGTGCSSLTEIATVGANTTTYQNTGLDQLTGYSYRVRAYNGGGNSAYSNAATASTPETPPSAPSALAATATSSSQIDLSWSDTANNETGFRIERCSGAGARIGENTTTHQDTGLTAVTSYT